MFHIKRQGFTLLEVLAAILIIGIIAVMVMPSLTKNIQDKTNMSLLKGTVSSVDNVVQAELTKQRTDDILLTDIYKNPRAFLEKFDLAKSGEAFSTTYKKLSNSSKIGVLIPEENNRVLLKNGVGLGIINGDDDKYTTVVVDVTGSAKPNIVGVDYFVFKIEWEDNYSDGYRTGDVNSFKNVNSEGAESKSALKTLCEDGDGAACYRLVVLSSYDPEYLKKEYLD